MSVPVTLDDQSVICRTCLKVLESRTSGFTYLDDENGYIKNVGNIREMLQFCIPELDLYVSTQPAICYQCLQCLVQVYNFKNRCLSGENIIRAYITRNNLQEYNHVNLNCVVMDELKLKSQKLQIESRIKHYMLQENMPQGLTPFGKSTDEYSALDNLPELTEIPEETNESQLEPEIIETQPDIPATIQPIIESVKTVEVETTEPAEKQMKIEIEESNPNVMDYDCSIEEINNEDTCEETEEEYQSNPSEEINPSDKMTNIIVRKDLFDTSTAPTPTPVTEAQPSIIINNGVLTKNGRIIIKIDRKRLQNMTAMASNNNSVVESSSPQLSISSQAAAVLKPIETIEVPTDAQASDTTEQEEEPASQVYKCNKCSFSTTDVIKMYDHNRSFHSFDYTCQHCPFSTSKVELLGKHMSMVHPKSVMNQMRNYKVTENYACTICPFSVKSIDLLRSHHLTAHGGSVEKAVKGPIILNRAFSGHHEDGPHILKRTEYSCDVCNYTTKDKSNLRKHLFTHGTKPLKCDHCTYKCVSPYQLRRHQKQKHAKVCEFKGRSGPYTLPKLTKMEDPDRFKITLDTLQNEMEK